MFDRVEAFFRPDNIPDALRLFQIGNGGARFLAGGTDLIHQENGSARSLIDLTQLALRYIRRRDGGWQIGATTTISDLDASPALRSLAGGILAKAALHSGPPQVRNMATVGGRLSSRSQFNEIATSLVALDAAAILVQGKRRFTVRIEELVEKAPAPGTLLIEVEIPPPPAGGHTGWAFHKLSRTQSDISLVNAAVGLQMGRGKQPHCKWLRIVMGAAGKPPALLVVKDQVLDTLFIDRTWERIEASAKTTDSVRGSAAYLREMHGVVARRALLEAARNAGCKL